MRSPNHSLWSRLVAFGLPFYRSEARRRAWGGLVLLLVLLLTINGLNVVNSYAGRDFMTARAERQARAFYVNALVLAGVFGLSTVVEVFARYAEQQLGLVWRQWLTRRLLDRYLAGRTYLRLADRHDIDNPDERISEDVKTFTATTAWGCQSCLTGPLTVDIVILVLPMGQVIRGRRLGTAAAHVC
jgi:putative ATP-binding cassette transporter